MCMRVRVCAGEEGGGDACHTGSGLETIATSERYMHAKCVNIWRVDEYAQPL